MKSISKAMSSLLSLDAMSRKKTPAHALDARIQILTNLSFIVVISSFPYTYIGALLPLFAFPAAVMSLGEIPASAVWRRIRLTLPFILLVAVWNPVFETRAVHVFSHPLNAGWISASSIVLRAILATSAIVLLMACTGMPRITHALHRLKIPNSIATLFILIYRFLFVIVSEAERLLRAFFLRSAKSRELKPKQVARLLGVLLARAVERSDRIHLAMAARRFQTRLPHFEPNRPFTVTDIAWFFSWNIFFVACRVFPMFEFLNFDYKGLLR